MVVVSTLSQELEAPMDTTEPEAPMNTTEHKAEEEPVEIQAPVETQSPVEPPMEFEAPRTPAAPVKMQARVDRDRPPKRTCTNSDTTDAITIKANGGTSEGSKRKSAKP